MSDLKFDQILDEYVRFCNDSGKIDLNLYEEYNVKRGLRDSNGRGVLTGLTEVSDVMGFSVVDGHRVPIPGELYFQGYEVQQLVQGFRNSQYGFDDKSVAHEMYYAFVSDPGNYCKYVLGMLGFEQLKTKAQSELSDKFNLKNFHQYVLDMGPVQFDILFNNLDAWIKKEK